MPCDKIPHRLSLPLLTLLVFVWGACSGSPTPTGSGGDAGAPVDSLVVEADAGQQAPVDVPDSGPACIPSDEVCNRLDDDCDGEVDEGGVCGPERVVELSVSEWRTCARLSSGRIRCWGTGQVEAHVQVEDAIALSARFSTSCAIRAGGEVVCWGPEVIASEEIGDQLRSITLPEPATQISVGADHACALVESGLVFCWGSNEFGQLGSVEPTSAPEPIEVLGLTNVISLSAGDQYTCAVSDGRVLCFGLNDHGRVVGRTWRGFKEYPGITSATAVYAHSSHNCALHDGGKLTCWGRNREYAIADEDLGEVLGATDVANNVVDASITSGTTCAVLTNGSSRCLGAHGFLPYRTDFFYTHPIATLADVQSVAHGPNHGCALHRDASVSCWGWSGAGDLGPQAPIAISATPVAVRGPLALELRAFGDRTCVVDTDRVANCFGLNIGRDIDASLNYVATPERLSETRITRLAGGWYHRCSIYEDAQWPGPVECLGVPYLVGAPGPATPTLPTGIGDAIDLDASVGHTCAVRANGRVVCWGVNGPGALGTPAPRLATTPIEVPTVENATQVALGFGHSCALTRGGRIWCWGGSSTGQIGRVNAGPQPMEVPGIPPAEQIAANGHTTCALLESRAVVCWGGRYGAPARQIAGIEDAFEIAVGRDHACARLRDGSVSCWGDNTFGQLGDGTTQSRETPAAVAGLSRIRHVTAGRAHTCAVTSSGEASCWGWDGYGQLGQGTMTGHSKPVELVPAP